MAPTAASTGVSPLLAGVIYPSPNAAQPLYYQPVYSFHGTKYTHPLPLNAHNLSVISAPAPVLQRPDLLTSNQRTGDLATKPPINHRMRHGQSRGKLDDSALLS